MRKLSTVLTVFGVMSILAAPLSFGAVTLPFTDGFEGGALTANWTTNGTGAVTFPSDKPTGGGTKCVKFTFNELTLDVPSDPTENANVWAQVYARATGMGEEPDGAALDGCTAAFYIATNGHVYAINANGDNILDPGEWADTGATVTLTDNQSGWVGFVTHLEHFGNTYDLYMKASGGNAAGDTLTRIASGYGFYSNTVGGAESLTAFQVESELETRLDAVALRTATSTPGINNFGSIRTRTTPHVVGSWKYIPIGDHGWTGPTADTLAYELGSLLLSSGTEDDVLKVWTTNGWSVFTYSNNAALGPGWGKDSGSLDSDEVHLKDGDVAYIQYASSPSPAFDVYAAGYVPETGTPPAVPSGGYSLYGTDNTYVKGWTPIVYGGKVQALTASGLGTAVGADDVEVFVREQNGNVYQYRYRSGGQWYLGKNVTDFTLRPGQNMWIRRGAGPVQPWTPTP